MWRLDEVVQGRDNNLTLLRFLAASAVVYGHSFGILGLTDREPFFSVMGRGLGDFGVDIFFVVSGLLVTKSLLGKSSLGAFAWARVIRVFPALWLSVIIWVVVAGLWLSPLSAIDFWRQPETATFIWKNLTMLPGFGAQTELPNTLAASREFNVPLWTLPHELQMYALLASLGVLGLVRSGWFCVVLAVFGLVNFGFDLMGFPTVLGGTRARFLLFFFAGACLYLYRSHIVVRPIGFWALAAAVFGVCLATDQFALRQLALALATPYLVLWLAYGPAGWVRRFNVLGDYSYGIYIFAFPLQLIVFHFLDVREPALHFILSIAAVLPFAIASWHLFESKLLRIAPPHLIETFVRLGASASSGSLGKVQP